MILFLYIRYHYKDTSGGFREEVAYWDVFPLGCNSYTNSYNLAIDNSAVGADSELAKTNYYYFPNGLTGKVVNKPVDAAIFCNTNGTGY